MNQEVASTEKMSQPSQSTDINLASLRTLSPTSNGISSWTRRRCTFCCHKHQFHIETLCTEQDGQASCRCSTPQGEDAGVVIWNVVSVGRVSECYRCLHPCMKSMLRCQHRVWWKLGHTLGHFLSSETVWLHCDGSFYPFVDSTADCLSQSNAKLACSYAKFTSRLIVRWEKKNQMKRTITTLRWSFQPMFTKYFLYILQLLFVSAWKTFMQLTSAMCFQDCF